MQRRSVTISAALHIALLIIATLGLPFMPKRDFVVPPPIMVDYIEIAKETQTDKVAPAPPPKPEKEDAPRPEEKRPPKAAQNTSNEAVAPVKEIPKPEEKKEKKPAKEAVDPNALPEKDAKKKLKEEEAKPAPPKDFSSVLKNLADEKDKPPVKTDDPDLKLREMMKSVAGQNAPLGVKMTMSEVDAFRSQLESCWNVPFGAKDVADMGVDIFMAMNPDRTLREARIVDTARYNSDSFFRAVADSALRAVRSPLCSPFQLPPDKYDTWKTVTITFNPKDMF